jgi:hypothetical protein
MFNIKFINFFKFYFRQFCPCCTSVRSVLSRLVLSVMSTTGNPLLSCLSCPDALCLLFCCGCPSVLLSARLSFRDFPITRASADAFSISPVLSWLSSDCPVTAVLSWMSYQGFCLIAVLSRFSFYRYPVMGLCWHSCLGSVYHGCSVSSIPVLSGLAFHECYGFNVAFLWVIIKCICFSFALFLHSSWP